MPTLTCTSEVGPDGLAALRAPREGFVSERLSADGSFALETGPVRRWHRTLAVEPLAGDRSRVTEHIDFTLAIPLWAPVFVWPVKLQLRREHAELIAERDGEAAGASWVRPFWAPPDRFDARASTVLALVCVLSLVTGYLGTVMTQTITYSASEFHRGTTAQGAVLAAVRVGVLVAVVLTAAADRRGRRRLLLASLVAACVVTAVGAAMPDLWSLGATQAVAQGLATAGSLLLGVLVAEEVPAGSRAWAVSVMTMCVGLGAGICVWLLPLADLGSRGWRAIYVVPLAGIAVVMWSGQQLPESRRFLVHQTDGAAPVRTDAEIHRRRFWLLAFASFGIALFLAPMAQLQNDFLRHERHYSAAAITAYTLVTGTPAGLGILAGGWLADVRGRRVVAAVGIFGGALLAVSTLLTYGPTMWLLSIVGGIIAAAAIPAMGVYGPELFPTLLRGRVNGLLEVVTVAGSSIGLLLGGFLRDRLGAFGPAMAILLVGPLLVAVLVVAAFPETAGQVLEDLNPEDRHP